jgi:hypothetical protein
MKKAPSRVPPDIGSEYDFARMKGGVRGKHARRLRSRSNLVLLHPDLAAAFRSDAAVNETLRAALTVARVVSKSRRQRHGRVRRASARTINRRRRKASGVPR